jgi:hypothetical protein
MFFAHAESHVLQCEMITSGVFSTTNPKVTIILGKAYGVKISSNRSIRTEGPAQTIHSQEYSFRMYFCAYSALVDIL